MPLFPLRSLTNSTTVKQCGLPHPGEYLRLHPLLCTRCAETKNNCPKGKNRSQLPPKIQVSDEEIANLSGAQFKTLVIRMLTEMVEYGHRIEEKVKTMKSEIKENVQGTNSNRKDTDSNQQFGVEGRKKQSMRTE